MAVLLLDTPVIQLEYVDANTDRLFWLPIAGATSYELEKAESTDFSGAVNLPNADTDLLHAIDGQAHFYRARAIDATATKGPSEWSTPVTVRNNGAPVMVTEPGTRTIVSKTVERLVHYYLRDVRAVFFTDDTKIECITDEEFNKRLLLFPAVYTQVSDGTIIYSPNPL